MFSYDCVLAAALLTTPVDAAEATPHLEWVRIPFLQLAIEVEILDPLEEQYLQGLSQDIIGDWRALSARYRYLLDAPGVDEAERFPQRRIVEDYLALNRAYRKELLASLDFDPFRGEALRDAIQELDRRHHVWSLLRDARCGYHYVTVRRGALLQLRDLIGAEAYYRSRMPSPVPLAHFPRR